MGSTASVCENTRYPDQNRWWHPNQHDQSFHRYSNSGDISQQRMTGGLPLPIQNASSISFVEDAGSDMSSLHNHIQCLDEYSMVAVDTAQLWHQFRFNEKAGYGNKKLSWLRCIGRQRYTIRNVFPAKKTASFMLKTQHAGFAAVTKLLNSTKKITNTEVSHSTNRCVSY